MTEVNEAYLDALVEHGFQAAGVGKRYHSVRLSECPAPGSALGASLMAWLKATHQSQSVHQHSLLVADMAPSPYMHVLARAYLLLGYAACVFDVAVCARALRDGDREVLMPLMDRVSDADHVFLVGAGSTRGENPLSPEVAYMVERTLVRMHDDDKRLHFGIAATATQASVAGVGLLRRWWDQEIENMLRDNVVVFSA